MMVEHYYARWLVKNPLEILPRTALQVAADGRVCGYAPGSNGAEQSGPWRGDVVLVPGYVNAHAHLELPALVGPQPVGFVPWIGSVLRHRLELGPADYAVQVDAGLGRALRSGTTAIGEVDSCGAGAARLARAPLHGRVYRELLDGDDGSRTTEQIARLSEPFETEILPGLSPHAPHTASDELLRACAREARARRLPVSIHWAESQEEVEWLQGGTGPFAPYFQRSPGCSGLQRLERAGILDLPLSLVHGNHPEPGDLEQLARRGVSLIHCPGTHDYFDRAPAAVEEWARMGLSVALGTDSLASNVDLDMGREMSLLRKQHPSLRPATVLDWATRGGARALALEDQIGDLAVGKAADFIAVDASGMETEADVLEALTSSRPEVLGVWIAGRQVSLSQ